MFSQILRFTSTIEWPTRAQMRQIILDNGMYNGELFPNYNEVSMTNYCDLMDQYYLYQSTDSGYVGQLLFQESGSTSWNVSLWVDEGSLTTFTDNVIQQSFYNDLIQARTAIFGTASVSLDSKFSDMLTESSTLADVKTAFNVV